LQNHYDPIPNPSPAGEGSPNAQATAAASVVESSPSLSAASLWQAERGS